MVEYPLVSAVIPTRSRPELVKRAVRTALDQTYPRLEVIVVVDGPDPATTSELASIEDARVRVTVLPHSKGGSGARNAGVEAARGEWIAFLDDDDEWLPENISRQLATALSSRYQDPVVSSRIIARTPHRDYRWPRRLPSPKEQISDYLFSRNSLFQGEGLIPTPTIFARKDLLLQVPFRQGLKKHQDWDWIVRVARHSGVGFDFEEQPLAICYMDQRAPGISNSADWRFSLEWAHEMRTYLTPQSYAAFVLIVVAAQAAGSAGWREYCDLLWDSRRLGDCRALHVMLFAGLRIFPRGMRRTLRSWFGRS